MIVHAQVWEGNFTADSSCDTSQCCCLSGQIVISHPESASISFYASLTGMCFGLTDYSGTSDYPSGYIISVAIAFITLTIKLSNDSNYIDIDNSLGAACSVHAARDITTTVPIELISTSVPVGVVSTTVPVDVVSTTTHVGVVFTTVHGNDGVRKYINIFTFLILPFVYLL
ncbi:unnamed protein product [Rotaria sordida]|uniref:Uncharacterized protein n=1 Tax=Rotaria sordida TaxID=392033 RepID=A0A814SHR5_9BILA|nr:unnamed protein product [Rotaria sordida]CAF1383666.1 unnamed protein product [Rotaria sordida]